MITEKQSIKCEVVYSDETKQHRLQWSQIWDKNKPIACVIMLNPCAADCLIYDTTTYLVQNNIASLEKYGGVHIVNIYSKLTSKLNLRWDSDEELNDPDNDTYIKKCAAESEIVVCAWGTGAITNKRVLARAKSVVAMLKPFSKKLYVITDGAELRGVHALTPAVRNQWILKPFEARDLEVAVKTKVTKTTTDTDADEDDGGTDVTKAEEKASDKNLMPTDGGDDADDGSAVVEDEEKSNAGTDGDENEASNES
jgi:hypothetical protein